MTTRSTKNTSCDDDKMTTVPRGKVLLVAWSDWFSYEAGIMAYAAGSAVTKEQLKNGELLHEGESRVKREKFRDDGALTWTVHEIEITNQGGKAIERTLKSFSD